MVVEVVSDHSQYDKFKKNMDALLVLLDEKRSKLQFATIVVMLGVSYFASMQSKLFAGSFIDDIARPQEFNLTQPIVAVLKPAVEWSSFAANFSIPLISADKAVVAFFSMMGCVITALPTYMGCQRETLKKWRRERGWESHSALGLALLVLSMAMVGSVANTLSAYDAKREHHDSDWSTGILMVVCMGIVQLAQNTRSLLALCREDLSPVVLSQMRYYDALKYRETNHRAPAELKAWSVGDPKSFPSWARLSLAVSALAPIVLYNITASIMPVAKEFPSWGVAAYGIGLLNFMVKSALFLRASTTKVKRVLAYEKTSWSDKAAFTLLLVPGVLSMAGAANFPKHYYFDNAENLSSTYASIAVVELAALSLNFGDLFDASRIIWTYTIGLLIAGCQSVKSRYGETFDDFADHLVHKAAARDPHGDWYPVAQPRNDSTTLEASELGRPRWVKALGLTEEPRFFSPVGSDRELPLLAGEEVVGAHYRTKKSSSMRQHWKASQELASLKRELTEEGMNDLYNRYMEEREQALMLGLSVKR